MRDSKRNIYVLFFSFWGLPSPRPINFAPNLWLVATPLIIILSLMWLLLP